MANNSIKQPQCPECLQEKTQDELNANEGFCQECYLKVHPQEEEKEQESSNDSTTP